MDQPQTPPNQSSIELSPKRKSSSIREIYFPFKREEHRDAIYIASFPQIIYFWPTIFIFLFAAFSQGVLGIGDASLGWIALIVLSLNLLVLVQDFDQKQFVILVLILVALSMGVWIVDLYGFTFLKRISSWILSFQPQMSTDAYLLFGLMLLVLFVWGLIAPLFSYWRLEQNEFVHYTQPIGKDMSIARTSCTVYKEIPDVLECILGFGAGCLIIRKDSQVLATIPHIPFLGMRMKSIEHMLSETRVIVEREN